MKNKFTFLFILVILFGCSGDDDLNVILNTSGSASLGFTSGSEPFADAEVRVANAFVTTDFQSGNVFEGVTDANGTISIGPLNEGTYQFRVDLGDEGFFIEVFNVISGSVV